MSTVRITTTKKEVTHVKVQFPLFKAKITSSHINIFAAWNNTQTLMAVSIGTFLSITANAGVSNTIDIAEKLEWDNITEQEFFEEYRRLMEKMPFDRSKEINQEVKNIPTMFRNNEINNQTSHY